MPYCLGASIARYESGFFDTGFFLIGLFGLFFVLVGVEAFNEYFDWVLGTDRAFQIDPKPITKRKFYIGIASFSVALIFAIYLALKVGIGIFAFAVFGFIAAYGYLGSPLRFTYRGLGEVVIAAAYGPAMVMGSYYLQTGEIAFYPLMVSMIPAILLFSIAIMNEVPDFLQDRLVGKRNICVRIGREKTVVLYGFNMAFCFAVCMALLILRFLPPLGYLTIALTPLAWRGYKIAKPNLESPLQFVSAIRNTIILYMLMMAIVIFSYIAL